MVTDISVPTPERLKKDVQYLKEWISKEPHLPKVDDEMWLETFLCSNKFSLEKTKFKLENYYSLRTKYPEILKNRDPTSPEILNCRKCVKIAVSEKLLKDNVRVTYTKIEANAGEFDMIAYAKRAFMIADMMLLKQKNRPPRTVCIHDLGDCTYLHALKWLAETAKLAEIFNNAYTERTEAVHLVNFPFFGNQFRKYLPIYLPSKLRRKIHIHTAPNKTLFETMDKDVVCRDLGGNGPSLAELEEWTQKELEKYRKWFEEQDDICSDESLRRGNFDHLEEMKGSFRKLDVD